MLNLYFLKRDLPRQTIAYLNECRDQGKLVKYVCSGLAVTAESEQHARELASQPLPIPKGCTLQPDNTLKPGPAYGWMHDPETEVWLDPTKATCRILDLPVSETKKCEVSYRAFTETLVEEEP